MLKYFLLFSLLNAKLLESEIPRLRNTIGEKELAIQVSTATLVVESVKKRAEAIAGDCEKLQCQ